MHQAITHMNSALPEGYTTRAATREDIPGIHALYEAAHQADHIARAVSLEDQYAELEDTFLDWRKDSRLVLSSSGEVAALARVFCDPNPTERLRAELWAEVHPAHRGRGIGEYVLTWMEGRGRERLATFRQDLPRDMTHPVLRDVMQDRIRLFTRHGFSPLRFFYRMRRDLRKPIPAKPLPAGLALQTYDASIDSALRDAFNASFADHWGSTYHSEKDWRTFFIGRASFRPQWTYAALDGVQVVGFSINRQEREEIDGQVVPTGHLGQIGVIRAWRKRGVATALICESMRTFRAAGLDWACLGVDTDNPTGALGLYEDLGFEPYDRSIVFGKRVE